MGGICLDKRYVYVALTISLVLFFTAGLSLSQDISQPQANATSMADIANINATATQNLRFIWTITGIENDKVTMALDQDGQYLFGRAKYEPDNGDPWNGNVAGFISGDEVHLVITALKGDKQVSTGLDGIFADDAISGKFFKTSDGKISDRGVFNAIWINPDLSSYTPVEIKENESAMQSQTTSATAAAYTDQTSQQKTIYHDVHQDADRILTGVGDISQIPIGMGGSGLP